MSTTQPVSLEFPGGKVITLRETTHPTNGKTKLQARPGDLDYVGPWGVNIPMTLVSNNGNLPTGTVKVRQGNKSIGTITLVNGVTKAVGKSHGGKPKVSGSNSVNVNVGGDTQPLQIMKISDQGDGIANVLIQTTFPSEKKVHNSL